MMASRPRPSSLTVKSQRFLVFVAILVCLTSTFLFVLPEHLYASNEVETPGSSSHKDPAPNENKQGCLPAQSPIKIGTRNSSQPCVVMNLSGPIPPAPFDIEKHDGVTSLEIAKTLMEGQKDQRDHIRSVIDIVSILVVLLIGGLGFLGFTKLKDLRCDLDEKVVGIRDTTTKEIQRISDDMIEFKAALQSNVNEVDIKTKEALTQLSAERKSLEDFRLALTKTQSELDASFQSVVALMAAYEQWKDKSPPALRKAKRLVDKVIFQLKPMEPQLMRSAHGLKGVIEKRLINAAAALQAVEPVLGLDDMEGYLHYNAACYAALCNDHQKWPIYLAEAITRNSDWIEEARTDTDFDGVRRNPQFGTIIPIIL